jgi:hypothetical protein
MTANRRQRLPGSMKLNRPLQNRHRAWAALSGSQFNFNEVKNEKLQH